MQQHVEVLGEKVEVLREEEGTLYLGSLLKFKTFHDTEIDHWIF